MKKILKGLAYTIVALVTLTAGTAFYIHFAGLPTYTPRHVEFTVDVTPERIARGKRTATSLCAGATTIPRRAP